MRTLNTWCGDNATESSDIYSLGIVLWELVTHRQPYAQFTNPLQVMFQVARNKQETIPDNCPADFKQLILDCWSVASKCPKAAEITARLQPLLESKADLPTAALANLSLSPNPQAQPQAGVFKVKFQEEKFSSAAMMAFQKGYQFYNLADYEKALLFFQQAAAANYPFAYLYLGVMYQEGRGIKKDAVESVNCYRCAAEQGLAEAQFNLGMSYETGQGVGQDIRQAVVWYFFAAEQGQKDAQCALGECYYRGQGAPQDYAKAVSWLRRAAEQGDAKAQYNLGVCYHNGQGVPQDPHQAFIWCQRAAEQGDARAQCNVGYRYEKGQGVTQNGVQAYTWFQRAAEQGESNAQFKLGQCYANGQGVGKDLQQAKQWYEKAIAQGDARAKTALNALLQQNAAVVNKSASSAVSVAVKLDLKQTVASQVSNASKAGVGAFQTAYQFYSQGCYPKAFPYFQQAANEHYPSAYLYLGLMYQEGYGTAKDPAKSATWYGKAQQQENWLIKQARSGDAASQFYLGRYYQFGGGAKKDLVQAATCYHRAAEQGHAGAQLNLGNCYASGQGVAQDYKQAIICYRLAAEQKNAQAQFNLGLRYTNGQGVSKDLQQAKQWYEKAAAQGHERARAELQNFLQKSPPITRHPSSFFTPPAGKLDAKTVAKPAVKSGSKPDAKESTHNKVSVVSKRQPTPQTTPKAVAKVTPKATPKAIPKATPGKSLGK